VCVCVARLRGPTSARRAVLRIMFMRIMFMRIMFMRIKFLVRVLMKLNSKGGKRAHIQKGKNAPKFARVLKKCQ
jgi:hypothetical protein